MQLPEGLTIERLDGITEYRFTNSSEEAIDAWADDLAHLIQNTPPNQLFRVLMDVSPKEVDFSRYARMKSKEVFTCYRAHKGRYAFLFSSPTAPYYSRIFFASFGKLNFDLGYFNNREKALSWLRQSP